ncbi:MAG: RNA polymerase factor sigma-32 [Deltaproteobacteria bacterium]|nr:RNA polymerase factor sigma-32 [Deltaproteobacteria bacterium]
MATQGRKAKAQGQNAAAAPDAANPESAPGVRASKSDVKTKTQSRPAPAKAQKGPEEAAKKGAAKAAKAKKPAQAAEVEAEDTAASDEAADPVPLEPEVIDDRAQALPLEPEIADEDDGDEPEEADADLADTRLPVPAGRDLSRADALQRYLAEIARHPLLSREEETRLATKFQETHDPQLAYRLVTANLRLVVKIAFEYRRAAFNVLDLIQEGNVGLMQAVQKFDPTRGVKLSSYSAWWIRAYILRYLMDNWRMVKLGTTQAQRKLFFNLRKEQEKLIAQGFAPETKLLAEKLDVSEQDIREMDQRLGNDEFSLDTPVAGVDDARQTYLDRLSEPNEGAEVELGDEELKRVFREHLAEFGRTLLDEKDKFLFEHRIAVPEGEEPLTLQQVGDRYGFTRERARQLEARLTDRLREFMRERMPDFAQLSMRDEDEEEGP